MEAHFLHQDLFLHGHPDKSTKDTPIIDVFITTIQKSEKTRIPCLPLACTGTIPYICVVNTWNSHKLLDCNEMIVTHKLLDCNETIVTHKLLDCNVIIVTH